MDDDRRWARFWIGVCGLLLISAVVVSGLAWWAAKFEFGGVDPAAIIVALVALAVAVWTGWLAVRSQGVSDTDVRVWAERLAIAVGDSETKQRVQLLGGQDRTIDVTFVLQPAAAHNAQGARRHGALTGVVDYFRDLRPQRLVITGSPGAGKTVLAIELILGLLKNRDASEPVPVRISAASWDPGTGVQAWLITHLVKTYRLREATARALLKAHRVLPVIDGLDEMDHDDRGYGSRAGQALRALNAYQDGQEKARLVVTCRTSQYQELTAGHVWARDAARVELAPVTADQAARFIDAAAGTDQLPRWLPVLHALHQPGHPLAAALATPWRLTLAVTVYQQQHPATGVYLRDPAALPDQGTVDQVRRHLLDLFIPAATAAARTPHPYHPNQVRAWLTVLARYLDANSGRPPFAGRSLSSTDLVLHELWPLGGHCPRVLSALVSTTALLACVPLAWLAPSPWAVAASLVGLCGYAVTRWLAWPPLSRLDPAELTKHAGRRRFALGMSSGLVSGLLMAFIDSRADLGAGLIVGLVLGIIFGVEMGSTVPPIRGGMVPFDPIINDVKGGLVNGLAYGLVLGLIGGFVVGFEVGPTDGLAVGLFYGPLVGLAVGFTETQVALRYFLLTLLMRKRLPRRLSRFLRWCYTDAGLLRAAGIAYQFRHRELQDYLAARF